jgi:arylsulfatase A-like enzyme
MDAFILRGTMNRRVFLTGVAAGVTSVLTAPRYGTADASSGNNKQAPPNILWIMLDDGRADSLGCYNAPWAKTPHLDRLAETGVRFDVAIVQNPVCVPSRRSMKTGHYAHEVGPVAMGKAPETPGRYIDTDKMAHLDKAPNLLDAWTRRGMKPINLGKAHGFRGSFDMREDSKVLIDVHGNPTKAYRDIYGENRSTPQGKRYVTKTHKWMIGGILDVRPEDTETWRLGDVAVKTLKEETATDNPFFLRVSFHAPHVGCYVPREYFIDPETIELPLPTQAELNSKPKFERGPIRTYAGAEDLTSEEIGICRGTYYGMVALVDVQVGRILEVLKSSGKLDNTIVALTSDQGFQLGEHGFWKKRAFYEGNVRVPLILNCPARLPRGREIHEPVEMIDFMPTLMELSDMKPPRGIRGRSLLPLIEGKVDAWREACFSELDHSQSMYEELRQGTGRRVMVRTKDWKLIFFMDERVQDKDGALYSLAEDPGETINRYADPACADVIKRLEKLARKWDARK